MTVVDLRPDARPVDGLAVIAGSTVVAAEGRRRVREVVVGAPGDQGGRTIPCDLVVLAGFQAPSTNLLAMTGAEVGFDEAAKAFLPTRAAPERPRRGRGRGRPLARRRDRAGPARGARGGGVARARRARRRRTASSALRAAAAPNGDPVVLPPEVGAGDGKQFACLCMDVTTRS